MNELNEWGGALDIYAISLAARCSTVILCEGTRPEQFWPEASDKQAAILWKPDEHHYEAVIGSRPKKQIEHATMFEPKGKKEGGRPVRASIKRDKKVARRTKVKPIKRPIVVELQGKHRKGKQAATAAANTDTQIVLPNPTPTSNVHVTRKGMTTKWIPKLKRWEPSRHVLYCRE